MHRCGVLKVVSPVVLVTLQHQDSMVRPIYGSAFCAPHSGGQVSVSKHAGHTKSLNSLTVTLPGSPQLPKTFFLDLRQEINLLTLVEDLDILGYLYFFIENFNNSILFK